MLAVDLSLAPGQDLPDAYWGLGEGTREASPARLPLDALFAALGALGAVAIGEKLMLVAIVLLAGAGMHRAAPVQSEVARVYAGLLYAVNPFVYDRLYTGQWFLLLGYALMPAAYVAFQRVLDGRPLAPWVFAGLWLMLGVASTHMALLLAVLCAAAAAARWRTLRDRARLLGLAKGAGLALAVSLWWLIPTPGLSDFLDQVDESHLSLYRTVAHDDWGLVPTVAALSGYWNTDFPAISFLSPWPLIALCLLVIAGWGLVATRRDPRSWGVAAAGLLGFLLALGDASAVTEPVYTWLVDNVAGFRSFREPQKGVALLAFAYAYLGAIGVERIRATPDAMTRAAALVGLIALPVVFGHRTLWGLWGRMDTTTFPDSWEEANDHLRSRAGDARTLFLPWSGYVRLGFTHGRVVANPAHGFFDVPLLASRSIGEGEVVSDNADPTQGYVDRLLRERPLRRDLARCLAPLGVRYVLVAGAGEGTARRLAGAGFDVERRWSDLTLLRSSERSALMMERTNEARGCAARVRPVAFERESRVRYVLDRPVEPRALVVGLSQARHWSVDGREVTYDRWPAYRRNYLIGAGGLVVFAASGALSLRARRRSPGEDRV